MDKLVYLLPALGCAVMMGAMMWMMRGGHAGQAATAERPDPATREEITMLRAEIATLRAAQTPSAAEEPDPASRRGGAA